jgi:hypothetical protein
MSDKHTSKYTHEQIDSMSWKMLRAAAKEELEAQGFKGSWSSDCQTPRLKAMLKGEMTVAEAEAAVLADKAKKAGISLGGGIDATALKPIEAKLTELAGIVSSLDDEVTTAKSEAAKLVGDLHTEMSDRLTESHDAFTKLQDAVTSALASGGSAAAKVIAPILGVPTPSSSDPVVMALEMFCAPGRAIKPLLVKGGQGAGKTYAARQHGMTAGFDRCVEFGVHSQTEAVDFLGMMMPSGEWLDGPLTEAFRAAALGQLVLLIIDEIYRGQNGARTPLLTATSPATLPSGERVYRLRTGRAIVDPVTGVHTSEIIEAPCQNLAIVATTNVGAEFNVDPGCPAERERFIPIHVEVDEAKIRAVCGAIATAKGYSSSVVDRTLAFYRECNVLKTDGFIELCPSTRILSEAIQYADSEANVKSMLRSLGLHIWVGTTIEGKPEEEQVKRVTTALDKAFGK